MVHFPSISQTFQLADWNALNTPDILSELEFFSTAVFSSVNLILTVKQGQFMKSLLVNYIYNYIGFFVS